MVVLAIMFDEEAGRFDVQGNRKFDKVFNTDIFESSFQPSDVIPAQPCYFT